MSEKEVMAAEMLAAWLGLMTSRHERQFRRFNRRVEWYHQHHRPLIRRRLLDPALLN